MRSSAQRSGRTATPAILLAEDHADSREALRALLEAGGYRVHLAHNGREAVLRAVELQPDLILMDMMMPEMDGLEATRSLRASPGFRQVPIIALTAMEGGRDRAIAAGCDAFVAKPLDVGVLFRTVEEWLQSGRPDD